MSLLDILRERAEALGTKPTKAQAAYVYGGYRTAVAYSSEFRRIESLPRRQWAPDPQLEEMLTSELRAPGGSMRLWPAQAAALRDIVLQRGAFLPVGVGQGKALISLLAPVVLETERPVLFVPAALREQTLQHVIPQMRRHWKLHPKLRVIGYSELSLEKNAEMLEELQPDLAVCDECHYLKNDHAGRTRRMVRWFRAHPETVCVAMSGTVSTRSLRDFAHILRWCLKGSTPLPEKWHELQDWADCVDEKVEEGKQVAPGALMKFCRPGENARQGFRRRLTDTPGVIATEEGLLGVSLRLERFQGLQLPREVGGMINGLRNTWELPNGDMLTEAVALWRHVRELSLGMYYEWQPRPPREWMEARRAWKSYVRETLKNNRRGLDTELQVWNECAKAPNEEWSAWASIKDTFRPNSVPVWVDDFALRACTKWLHDRTCKEPGICWVEHVAFGERLAEVSGCAYFGAGDDGILTCDHSGIVASIAAHAEGKNLQRFSRNLVTSPPTSGKVWEQLLGRTHRAGQEADEVTCEVMVDVDEQLNSFAQALADARYIEDTLGNRQKLNYADQTIVQL